MLIQFLGLYLTGRYQTIGYVKKYGNQPHLSRAKVKGHYGSIVSFGEWEKTPRLKGRLKKSLYDKPKLCIRSIASYCISWVYPNLAILKFNHKGFSLISSG